MKTIVGLTIAAALVLAACSDDNTTPPSEDGPNNKQDGPFLWPDYGYKLDGGFNPDLGDQGVVGDQGPAEKLWLIKAKGVTVAGCGMGDDCDPRVQITLGADVAISHQLTDVNDNQPVTWDDPLMVVKENTLLQNTINIKVEEFDCPFVGSDNMEDMGSCTFQFTIAHLAAGEAVIADCSGANTVKDLSFALSEVQPGQVAVYLESLTPTGGNEVRDPYLELTIGSLKGESHAILNATKNTTAAYHNLLFIGSAAAVTQSATMTVYDYDCDGNPGSLGTCSATFSAADVQSGTATVNTCGDASGLIFQLKTL